MLATMSNPPDYRVTATGPSHRPPAKAASRIKQRPSQSQPLDPDELKRRLYIVVAEQKAHSEKKRRARAEKDRRAGPSRPSSGKDKDKDKDKILAKDAARLTATKQESRNLPTQGYEARLKLEGEPHSFSSEQEAFKMSSDAGLKGREDSYSSSYRYIPQVAASQFARTTTVESPEKRLLVHRLSRKAMKFHLEGVNASPEISAAGPDASPFEQARALRRARGIRERQYGRNHVDHMPPLPATAEVDDNQAPIPHRHTFETHFNIKGIDSGEKTHTRRRSTGSILGRTDPPRVGSFDIPVGLFPVNRCESDETVLEHRVDWTQSDEAEVPLATPTPPLRKHESIWALRGRLGSFTKHGKDDKPVPPLDKKRASGESPKTPKAGFFRARGNHIS